MSSSVRTESEGCYSEFETNPVTASNVTESKISGSFLAAPFVDYCVYSEDPETWINSYCKIIMDDSHEQFLSSNCQVPSEEPVKMQSESNCLIASVLENQPTLADDWFGQQGGDLTMDASLEGLFQNEDIADFSSLETGSVAVTNLPLEDLILSSNNSSSMSTNCPAKHGPLPDKKMVLACNFSIDATDISMHGKTSVNITDAPDVNCASPEARKSSSISPTNQPQKVKGRGVKRRRSESTDDSDGDSQYSDTHLPSNEGLAQFAREFITKGRRTKPYFWQYNVQSRGPKGKRLCSTIEIEDSHVVPDFSDPVFGGSYQLSPWRHGGRARQGDGNDPKPDPMKLLNIGYHISCLETEFRTVGLETPGGGDNRSSANRQKNKLASRICRLKKKALHAANKIKLDGLKQEHNQLMQVIKSIITDVEQYLTTESARSVPLCHRLNMLIKDHLTFMIAGHTADYVNSELEKVARELISDQK